MMVLLITSRSCQLRTCIFRRDGQCAIEILNLTNEIDEYRKFNNGKDPSVPQECEHATLLREHILAYASLQREMLSNLHKIKVQFAEQV